jgi:geranylgeranyl diphosphate synthase, type II
MEAMSRIETTLSNAVAMAEQDSPAGLGAAIRHAVFPGGARIRPRLVIAAAAACGDRNPRLVNAAAASIELLHCASLVHDDLPCFDDADTRRGRPSVHAKFGERLAVLAGDALIVMAFQLFSEPKVLPVAYLPAVIGIVARAVGAPNGICAGQAWECEPYAPLQQYHRAKTGALFSAATQVGAVASGSDPAPWYALGERLGEAYQIADDIRDVACDASYLGKPNGRDEALGRPSAARELGLPAAVRRFKDLVQGAIDAIPGCPGANELRGLILIEARRLIPDEISRLAA